MRSKRLTVLTDSNSIISHYLADLRDTKIQSQRELFRANLRRIGSCMAYEVSKHLIYRQKSVRTPLGTKQCSVLQEQPVLGTVLRAGIGLHAGMLDIFPAADNAFIGAARQEEVKAGLSIKLDYVGAAKLEGRVLIFGDPMLASGQSMIQALAALSKHGNPREIHILAVIASKQGVKRLSQAFPKAYLWVGTVDPKLNSRAYIVPGLGDAGDLAYGPKL